jgi:hypothetical protein
MTAREFEVLKIRKCAFLLKLEIISRQNSSSEGIWRS